MTRRQAIKERLVTAICKEVDITIGPIHIKGRAVVVVPVVFGIFGIISALLFAVIKRPEIITVIIKAITK